MEAQQEGYGPKTDCQTVLNNSAQRHSCCMKFIRHPIVQSYLTSRFPLLQNPMLSDVHISLSNQSHLKAYLDRAKKVHFPEGTGWTGKLQKLVLALLTL
ncbi:hypothetical protein F5880DRAFT_1474690 [Lentinula raphanica]|nr:hypothetical protein F5880DRAFT_1474690 [Lentinula raphanica]